MKRVKRSTESFFFPVDRLFIYPTLLKGDLNDFLRQKICAELKEEMHGTDPFKSQLNLLARKASKLFSYHSLQARTKVGLFGNRFERGVKESKECHWWKFEVILLKGC
jgi:hypothetical protein